MDHRQLPSASSPGGASTKGIYWGRFIAAEPLQRFETVTTSDPVDWEASATPMPDTKLQIIAIPDYSAS